MMMRKHIFIPKDLDRQIKLMAKTSNKSESQVIRELIEKSVESETPSVGELFLKLSQMAVKTDDPNLSTNIDKYLYGDK